MASSSSKGASGSDLEKQVEKWKKRALSAETMLQHITSKLEEVKKRVDQVTDSMNALNRFTCIVCFLG